MNDKRIIDYGNEKLNEIFDLTWPNIGLAKTMSNKTRKENHKVDGVEKEQ